MKQGHFSELRFFTFKTAGLGCLATALILVVMARTEDPKPNHSAEPPRARGSTSRKNHRSGVNESGDRSGDGGSLIEAITKQRNRSELNTISVGGQVRRPGPVACFSIITLESAVEAAGGPTEFGATDRVGVIRSGSGPAMSFDLGDPDLKTLPLKAGDIVIVPERNIIVR